jgi:universal bacterial protein YeaZ
MKILAVESSASAASAAVWEDGKLLCESFTNIGLTHSQTLLPLVEQILSCAQIPFSEIGCYAVSVGPGSFTGVRIGVSLVKGLAFSSGTPCVPVSTLEAMAHLFTGQQVHVCCAMDARCGQVYNALFCVDGETVTRLCPDRALKAQELGEELTAEGSNWVLVGDGAELCWKLFGRENEKIALAPPHLRFQRASGVALAAQEVYNQQRTMPAAELAPVYLRPPQAERELKKRLSAPEKQEATAQNGKTGKGVRRE